MVASKVLERMSSDSIERSFEGLATPVGRSSSADNSSKQRLPHQEAVDRDSPVPLSLKRNVGGFNKITYSVACCMPKDRSGEQWEVTFAACYSHPTGIWVSAH